MDADRIIYFSYYNAPIPYRLKGGGAQLQGLYSLEPFLLIKPWLRELGFTYCFKTIVLKI